MNPLLITHIAKSYNDPSFSDFKLVERRGRKEIYLHSYVLRSNPFFAQYFQSPFAKAVMEVESIMVADKLARNIYTEYLYIDDMEPDDFFDLVQLAEMWQMPQKVIDVLFTFAYVRVEEFIQEDLAYANLLYRHFGTYFQSLGIYKSGLGLTCNIVGILAKSTDSITEEMLDWDIIQLLPTDILTELCIKFHRYENLNVMPITDGVLKHIRKYYNPEMGLFTPEQYSALMSANDLHPPPVNACGNYLAVDSFVPFRGCYYTSVGIVFGKSKLSHGVIMILRSGLKKTDHVYFNGKEYVVKSLFVHVEKVEDCAGIQSKQEFMLNPIECPTLPAKDTVMYRVTRW